jgi:hypothetical protein
MAENKLIGIEEASELTGLSLYLLRKGVKTGRFPVVQLAKGGKYLFDPKLLADSLNAEAMNNVQNNDSKAQI